MWIPLFLSLVLFLSTGTMEGPGESSGEGKSVASTMMWLLPLPICGYDNQQGQEKGQGKTRQGKRDGLLVILQVADEVEEARARELGQAWPHPPKNQQHPLTNKLQVACHKKTAIVRGKVMKRPRLDCKPDQGNKRQVPWEWPLDLHNFVQKVQTKPAQQSTYFNTKMWWI